MINKDELPQLIYKPASSTEKIVYLGKFGQNYCSMYIEERRRINAKWLNDKWLIANILKNSGW